MDRHDHGQAPSEDAFSPEADACPFTLVDLPCGCQDVHYACGYVDREHDHVACSGEPLPSSLVPSPGDRVTGWYDRFPYQGTVTAVQPPHPGCGGHVHITVRRDYGTEIETFSDAIQPLSGSGEVRRPRADRKVQALALLAVAVLVAAAAVVSIVRDYQVGLWACLAVEILALFLAVRWIRPHL